MKELWSHDFIVCVNSNVNFESNSVKTIFKAQATTKVYSNSRKPKFFLFIFITKQQIFLANFTFPPNPFLNHLSVTSNIPLCLLTFLFEWKEFFTFSSASQKRWIIFHDSCCLFTLPNTTTLLLKFLLTKCSGENEWAFAWRRNVWNVNTMKGEWKERKKGEKDLKFDESSFGRQRLKIALSNENIPERIMQFLSFNFICNEI